MSSEELELYIEEINTPLRYWEVVLCPGRTGSNQEKQQKRAP